MWRYVTIVAETRSGFAAMHPRATGTSGRLYLVLAISTTTTRRLGALLAFFALTFGLLAGPLALIAHADGNASAFVVEANLAKDGTLKVKVKAGIGGKTQTWTRVS